MGWHKKISVDQHLLMPKFMREQINVEPLGSMYLWLNKEKTSFIASKNEPDQENYFCMKLDRTGRFQVPEPMVIELNLLPQDMIDISPIQEGIQFTRAQDYCRLCSNTIENLKDIPICERCAEKVIKLFQK